MTRLRRTAQAAEAPRSRASAQQPDLFSARAPEPVGEELPERLSHCAGCGAVFDDPGLLLASLGCAPGALLCDSMCGPEAERHDWEERAGLAGEYMAGALLGPRPRLQVWGARVGYQGLDGLDISRKSGKDGLCFAPSWALLGPALDLRDAGELMPERFAAYALGYKAEMRASRRASLADWASLLARPVVTLLCYCTEAAQCHRRILGAEILPALGAEWRGERA